MLKSGGMSQLRRSAVIAGLCLYACGRFFVQDSSGAALDQAPSAQAQLDIMVSVGSKPAPGAALIAAEEGLQHVASARTDQRGRALLSVRPGRYRVSASLEGHHMQVAVARADSGSSVSVRLALIATDPFALVPPGSGLVSGRVLGTNGDAVPYATVTFDDQQYSSGGADQTAADGTFRIRVRAENAYDKVTVSGSAHIWSDIPPTVFLADRTTLQRSVRVQEKQETAGLELQVPTSPHYRVTVTLREELGGALVNPAIMLFGRNLHSNPLVRPDNTAVFGPLPRGPVTVVATADGRNGIRLAGVAELDVVDRPLDDVVLSLVAAARIRGRVEFQDRERQSPGGAAMLVLSSIPGRQPPPIHSNDPNGRVAPDGSFAIDGLLGTRCLGMWNVPPGWQLAAILRDGRDITDEPIAFSPGERIDDVVLRLVPGDRTLRRPACDRR